MRLTRIPGVGWFARRLGRAIDARVDAAVNARVGAMEHRMNELQSHDDWLHEMINRMGPQIAALETRLADRSFDERMAAAANDAERDALESASTEHQRIRERMALISQYEERLRRLEEHAG